MYFWFKLLSLSDNHCAQVLVTSKSTWSSLFASLRVLVLALEHECELALNLYHTISVTFNVECNENLKWEAGTGALLK